MVWRRNTWQRVRQRDRQRVILTCRRVIRTNVLSFGQAVSQTCWVHTYVLYIKHKHIELSITRRFYNIHKQCSTIYKGCTLGNVPDFGRMFLTLNYTDLTQNTYIRSWAVTEIMARENCGLFADPRTVPVHCACPSFSLTAESSTFRLHYQQMSQLQWIVIQYYWISMCHVKCLEP